MLHDSHFPNAILLTPLCASLSAIDFETFDLDADFDPDAHDQVMKQAFSDQYYQEHDAEMHDEDEDGKPVWDDDIDIDDIIQTEAQRTGKGTKRDAKGKAKAHAAKADDDEDGPIEMDADFLDGGEADTANDAGLSKKERKKLKKKIKAAEKKVAKRSGGEDVDGDAEGVAIDEMDASKALTASSGPATSKDDRKRKLNEAMDEYYNLDYEDVVSSRKDPTAEAFWVVLMLLHLSGRRSTYSLQVHASTKVVVRPHSSRNLTRGRQGAQQCRRPQAHSTLQTRRQQEAR